jgi:uncharacterized protein YjbI with pentapeptide repeats
MKGRALITRWANSEFQKRIEPLLDAIFSGNRELSGSYDLRGMEVGGQGPMEVLKDADFVSVRLTNVDLRTSRFSCDFDKGIFTGVNFTESTFDTCSMSKAVLSDCNFACAQIVAPSWDDATFEHCEFRNTRLKGRGLNEHGGRRTVFRACDFSGSTWSGLEFRAAKFIGCNFAGAKLRKCDLRGARFENGSPAVESLTDSNTSGMIIT